jgi:hypothetical protein
MGNVTELIQLLREQGDHETYEVAVEADVEATESAVGCSLPTSFSEFVMTFSNGAYLFGVQEVRAVGGGNAQIVAIQDIDRIVRLDPGAEVPFREGGEARFGQLVPFGLDSNGNEWCFVRDEQRPDAEYSVSYFDTQGRRLYGKLTGFTEWLTILAREQDEVIRTLYADDVIYDELMLG